LFMFTGSGHQHPNAMESQPWLVVVQTGHSNLNQSGPAHR
jgi:hypothetical protein